MKSSRVNLLVAGGVLSLTNFMAAGAAAKFPSPEHMPAQPGPSSHSFKPDQDFVEALARNDAAGLGRLLEDDFTWTDAQGRTLDKTRVLATMPLPALGDENQVDEQDFVDKKIAIHRVQRGNTYVLRVWVKHGMAWRVLAYQEVSTSVAPPQTDSGSGECENPCKTVPFTPRTDAEREVIESYQAVERAVTAHDSAAWGSHIANDFFAVTSNSDRPLDKQTRMAGLDHQKQGGIAPFPLSSARMFQYGDTMVMISQQQPANGKALHVTRIWVKQQKTWLEIFSYQTTIQ
ncbi:MAG: nuclear transport factor 2 family protein [Acidobacteriia bacterium]|nr:nuclear transport factor 2 family protein [Terriglobia bacterium]